MSDLEILENIGTAAVKQLRLRKLESGKPFMINSKDLPDKESYMEYPDHSISVVTIAANQRSFVTLRKLSPSEANAVRDKFDLQLL